MRKDDSELWWRDFSLDYGEALSEFRCAVPSGDVNAEPHGEYRYLPWEFEVQDIMSVIPWTQNPSVDRIRLAVRWTTPVDDELLGVCWIRIIDGCWDDSAGHYHIAAIARAVSARGTHMGWFILRDALRIIRDDVRQTGRSPHVSALIDWRNEPSIALFRGFGFTPEYKAGLMDGNYRAFTLDVNTCANL